MKDALIISTLSVLPKKRLSRLMGRINRTRFGGALQRFILQRYVSWYKVNLEECEGTLEDYPSLGEFFVRALRPGVRPVDARPEAIVCPVDGKIYAVGTVQSDKIPQSERQTFSASEMLGGGNWEGCPYAVIYLSPRDYHRVHVPREGQVVHARYSPGQLWPVFPAATRKIDGLFAKNERITATIRSDLGDYALVMVGAFGVGRMRVVFADWLTNEDGPAREADFSTELDRAAEIGRFEMGSTVVLVFPKDSLRWTVQNEQPVRLGECIALRT
jgi:phosphatidylserine decarboxylase